MIIEIGLNCHRSKTTIPVEITVTLDNSTSLHQQTLDLSHPLNRIEISAQLPYIAPSTISLRLATAHLAIVKHPLEISELTLDRFFSSTRMLHSGRRQFDLQFLQLAAKKQMFIDPDALCNRLDFTGSLIYDLKWPFCHNIWDNFRGFVR